MGVTMGEAMGEAMWGAMGGAMLFGGAICWGERRYPQLKMGVAMDRSTTNLICHALGCLVVFWT